MSQNSMVLNAQWSTRPNDQRFLSLAELHAKVAARRTSSRVHDVALEHLRVMPTESGEIALGAATGDHYGTLSHWAFGQLAQRAHAPAGYLRGLPAELAAVNLQWSVENLQDDETKDGKVLTRINGTDIAAAVTSPTYGRIWDADLTGALVARVDTNVWKVPGATYSHTDPKRATTLYASDRDVFVFLCNEQNAIEIPGEPAPKFRGFYAYNSETGNGKMGIAVFLYDRVCDNRIIWGMSEFREIAVRHTSGAPMRFVAEAVPQLNRYLTAKSSGEETVIKAAQAREVGKDRKSVVEWMRARGFSQTLAGRAYDTAEKEGIRNPRTLWGVVSGLTGAVRDVGHTDERIDTERKASALLDLV